MIFAHTIDEVLSGRKRQTTRLAYAGDYLGGDGTIRCHDDRPRWIIGHTYAVQPERCHPALGRIILRSAEHVRDVLPCSEEFARAEGFDSADGFAAVWRKLHPKVNPYGYWVLGFGLDFQTVAHAR